MPKPITSTRDTHGERAVLLMFPGQGAQQNRMAAGLYGHDPVFTAAIDDVFTAFGAEGRALRRDWLAANPDVPMEHVSRAQPLLFAVDYALGRTVLSWAVTPWAMLGHSMGEMAAAALAGVFTVDDCARLIADRVQRLQTAPPGGMLAVAAGVGELEPFLTTDVVVAAINAPRQTILAGPHQPLTAVAQTLRNQGLTCQTVASSTAFHSPAVAAATAGAYERFAATPTHSPQLTLYSGYTAEPLGPTEVKDPAYWTSHPVAPVRFWPALQAVLARRRDLVCVEAGPGQGLTSIARRHPAVRAGHSTTIALLPAAAGHDERDRASLAAARVALTVTAGAETLRT
jgi:acyl transferase domain-containing protein